jgi:enoyl-CoA hydratase/carnithine racemase
MFEHLLHTLPSENIQQITINRPRQLNALALQTIQELTRAIDDFETSRDHVLLLTGSGRAFCFGADFREFVHRDSLPSLLQLFQNLILKLYHCSKLIIACLNGFATGAGFDLALACDFRLAAEKVKMGEAYISMGLVPDGGGSSLLTRLVGPSRALEMFLTAEPITAEQALAYGVIHRVFSGSTFSQECLDFAKALAEKPQTALRLTKKLVKQNFDLNSALEKEREAQLVCFQDPIHQQLVRSFLEKRKKD